MLVPDEYLIRLLDDLVLRLHHVGISRTFQMRALAVASIAAAALFGMIRGEGLWLWFILFPAVILLLQFILESRVRLYGKKAYNTLQIMQRDHLVSLIRLPIYLMIVAPAVLNLPWRMDGLVLVLYLYSTWTLEPEEPPKRSWREALYEALAPRREALSS